MSQANETLLQRKYARIVNKLAIRLGVPSLRALDLFYRSRTYMLIRMKVGELHCMGDEYLVDEIIIELTRAQD